jgi:hypothetical protein
MHIADHSVAYALTKRVWKGQSPKIAQFAQVSTRFHMLQHGRSMMECESMRELYGFSQHATLEQITLVQQFRLDHGRILARYSYEKCQKYAWGSQIHRYLM